MTKRIALEKMKTFLDEGDVLEDLEAGRKIVQNNFLYKFSSDSILLADFAKVKKSDKVVELCSGCGVISFLMHIRHNLNSIVGFESDPCLFALSQKTILQNNFKAPQFINADLKTAVKLLGKQSADVIVCNPPYFKLPSDISKLNKKFLTSKYESTATLEELLGTCSKLLRSQGKLFLSYTTSRLQELLFLAEKFALKCKTLKFIFQKDSSDLVLIHFVKEGKSGCKIQKNE